MDVIVETAVQRVTVYPDRARVTAVGDCELKTGMHRLLVDELPLVLEPESVRVSGQGTAHVQIQSVDVTRHFYEESPVERARELEREIEGVEDELRVLADEKARWAAHGKYLNGLREATVEFAKGLSRGRTSVADQTDLLAFLQTQDEQMRAAVRDLDKQERELKRRLQKLQNELKQLRAARPRERFRALVDIEVIAAGSLQLEASYVVRDAGWQPLYDTRLLKTENGHVIDMTTIAQVTQQTGQDWLAVDLSVSTARPALNQRLPEVKPWYLDVYIPMPPQPAPMPRGRAVAATMAAAPMSEALSEEADTFTTMAAPAMMEAQATTAVANNEGMAMTFHVPHAADIPSDGSPHKTTLQQFQLDPRLDYLCAPKHTDAVYRRAVVSNTSGGPLLAGMITLFVGAEFIGRTQLAYTPAGGEIELLLGVEDRITVERELAKREVDKKMLRDVRRTRYGYEIECQNLLNEPAHVEVHDHIPVARNEQIKVKLDTARPTPSEHSDLNLLEWHLTLTPGVKQQIVYEFVVEYPPALHIIGLFE